MSVKSISDRKSSMRSIWRVTTRIYVLVDADDGDQYEHVLATRELKFASHDKAKSVARKLRTAITKLDMNEHIVVGVNEERLND